MQVCILLVAGSEKEGKEALFMARVQVPKRSQTTHKAAQKILLYEFQMYSTWLNAYDPRWLRKVQMLLCITVDAQALSPFPGELSH